MIYYSNRSLWQIIFFSQGSPFSESATLTRAVGATLVASILAVVHHFVPKFLHSPNETAEHALTLAFVFLALLITLRLYTAAQQWRNGVDTVSNIAEAARTLTSTACAFVHFSKKTADRNHTRAKCQFLRDLKRYILLYITLVFHDCHANDAPLELRQLLTEKEAMEFLSTDALSLGEHTWNKERNVVGSANKLRGAIVELWLRRTINTALRKDYISIDKAMTLNAIVTTFPQMYTRVFNLSNVPIPFNLAQYLHVWIIGYLSLYAVTIAPTTSWFTPLWVFGWSLLLFGADNVAVEIECPFGADSNDIDLESRMLCIQDELKVILQAHFHSVGLRESFAAEDMRMASLSSLLSTETTAKTRKHRDSTASSYSSAGKNSKSGSVISEKAGLLPTVASSGGMSSSTAGGGGGAYGATNKENNRNEDEEDEPQDSYHKVVISV